MSTSNLMLYLPEISLTIFFFALGASIGSMINVLVYRIPLGLSVVSPPSRCPGCDTRLTWRENIPILGWILLRGKCRFCGVKISPEYPIVEAFTALLFAGFYLLYYALSPHAELLGIPLGSVAPEWARNSLLTTWPAFIALLVLLTGLVSMTLIDARTYTIPLILAWVPTIAAAVILPAHAAWFAIDHGPLREASPGFYLAADGQRWYAAAGSLWTLATPSPTNWPLTLGAIAAVLGIPVSLALQKLGLLRHSFADYEAWEKQALADAAAETAETKQVTPNEPEAQARDQSTTPPKVPDSATDDPHLWIRYPHARREMFIEAAFIAPIAILAFAGSWLAGVLPLPPVAPLWVTVLGGVCLGYLVGGGVVWAVRIFGSLAFGKEAMGIGDVHLMAAVGACLGWPDAVLGFFGAAFVGLAYAIAGAIVGGKLTRAMPFGPFLAVSTLLVLLFKPAIEIGLGRLFSAAAVIDLP